MDILNRVDKTRIVKRREVPVFEGDIAVQELRFWPKNPRIYSVVAAGKAADATQDEIYRELVKKEHVKALIQSIQDIGALLEPVIVKAGTWEVLEGNSRLAAYKWLIKHKDKVKWGRMTCQVLPEDVPDEVINAILGVHLLLGKTSWSPFEQAGFVTRRSEEDEFNLTELAKDTGISKRKIEHYIEAYNIMVEKEEPANRFSHWYEYVNNAAVRKMRKEFPAMDDIVADKIKSREIKDARDVRDKLPVIAKAKKKKIRRQFIEGEIDFDDSYEDAASDPSQSQSYVKTEQFLKFLGKNDTELSVVQSSGDTRNKIKFNLGKIRKRCDYLLGLIG